MPKATPQLICPSCARSYGNDERFCVACGLPLTQPGAAEEPQPVSERHRRARKIKPQFSEGQLVRAVGASNQAEAEFIQGLLLEQGIPSVLRRSAGFDVPDFLAAGPRDVLVPESGLVSAREVLLEAELLPAGEPRAAVVSPARLMAGILVALAVGALIVWVATRLAA